MSAPADKDDASLDCTVVVSDNASLDGTVVAPTDLIEPPDSSSAQRKSIERITNAIGSKFVSRPQACEFEPALPKSADTTVAR